MGRVRIRTTHDRLREAFADYIRIPSSNSVITLNDEEFGILRETESIGEGCVLEEIRCIPYTNGHDIFIGVVGEIEMSLSSDWEEVELTPFHFFCIFGLSDFSIQSNQTKEDIVNCLYPIATGDGELDFDQFLKFFPKVRVIKMNTSQFDDDQLKDIMIDWVYSDPSFRRLNFTDEFIAHLIKLHEMGYYDDYMLEAYRAEKWRYCFLRLYRCLEPLFNNLIAKKLKQSFSLANTIDDITRSLQSHHLVWPNEKDHIAELFDLLPVEIFYDYRAALELNDDKTLKKGTMGTYIYKIRNRIVHHPSSSSNKKEISEPHIEISNFSEEKWQNICVCLLKSLLNLNIQLS